MTALPARPWEDYDHTPFADLPPQTWSRELFQAGELTDALVAGHALAILRALEIPVPGHLDLLADDLALGTRVHEGRSYAFHWLFRWLHARGLLLGDPGEEINDVEPLPWSEETLRAARERLEPVSGTTFALLDHVAQAYPAWLRAEVHGARVLFTREALALWEGYFTNANVTCGAVNALAAWAAERALDEAGLERARVLEVGGGLGSGAEALTGRLGARVARYTFTELAPAFLQRGEAHLRAARPGLALEARRLDLNDAFQEEPGSYELIFAVNTLHAVRDLEDVLARLRELLVPGGVLVLGESVRPRPREPIAVELVFQLTREFQSFQPVAGLREHGGFLPHTSWVPLLERAGYAEARCLPDLEAVHASYPAYAMAALVARRPL